MIRIHQPFLTVLFVLISSGCFAQDPFDKSKSSDEKQEPDVAWGTDAEGSAVSMDERTPVTNSSPPGSTMIIGRQVFDTEKMLVRGTLADEYEDSGLRALSTDGRYFAACAKSENQKDTAIDVWDTESGEKILHIPGDEEEYLDNMIFTRDQYLLFCGRNSAAIHVWDVKEGEWVMDIEIPEDVRRIKDGQLAFTQDGLYFAMPFRDELKVIKTETEKTVATMAAPTIADATFVYAWMQDVKFSPDSQELAAVTTHPDPHLLCWNNRGQLVLEKRYRLPDRKAFWEHKFQWLPDNSGWFIGGSILERESGRIVLSLYEPFASDIRAYVVDKNHLIGRFASNQKTIKKVEIPWERIRESLTAMESDTDAYLAPGSEVGLEIQFGATRGNQAELQKMMRDALTERLKEDGITVGENAETYFRLRISETAGDTLPIFESQLPVPFGGRDTGRRATEAKGQLVVELVSSGLEKPLYREAFDSQSSRFFINEDINNQTIRESMLRGLEGQLGELRIPYYLPKDKSLLALPVVVR